MLPSCGEWNTLVEEIDLSGSESSIVVPLGSPAVPIAEVDAAARHPARSTGLSRARPRARRRAGPRSGDLVGGEPGVGKSTLLLQVASEMAKSGGRVLYVSAEESPQQVRIRAERLGALAAC